MLAYILHSYGTSGLIVEILVAAVLIWIIFYLLPLPDVLRTIFAVAVGLLLVLSFFGCSAYESTVASRTVGAKGYTKDGAYGGEIFDSVQYDLPRKSSK